MSQLKINRKADETGQLVTPLLCVANICIQYLVVRPIQS
jgi:hypothetical protein